MPSNREKALDAQLPEHPELVTHHLEEIPAGFTHALLMQDGKILARGEIGATITSAAISETFRFPLQVSYQDGRFSAIAS